MYIYSNRQVINEQVLPCTPPEYSFVRIFHSLPELPPIDIYVNNMLRAKNLRYKDMTPYMPSAFENYQVQIFLSGDTSNPIINISDLTIPRGQIITFAATGSLSDMILTAIIDDINVNVDPDETKIRFYNLDVSPITFSISLPGGSISRSLSTGQGTEYIEINPGEHIFQVNSANQNIPPISVNLNLKPGRIYTLYTTGSMDPTSPGYTQGNIPQIILTVDGNTFLKKCAL